MTVIDLLETIKARPAFYIGRKDMYALRHFLNGYIVAMREIDPDYSDELLSGFTAWLAQRYKDDRDVDWDTLISVHEADPVNTDTFFRLMDEYLSARGVISYKRHLKECMFNQRVAFFIGRRALNDRSVVCCPV